MHVRTQIKFAGCAAETLSATMNVPFPADSPFFRRGIPALSIDFQDRGSHFYTKRWMQLARLSRRASPGANGYARRRQTCKGTAAVAVCRSAIYRQFGPARNAAIFS